MTAKWFRSKPPPSDQLSIAIECRVWVTWAALLWEVIWPRLWPAIGILGAFIVVSLWDVWLKVPGIVHAAVLVLVIGATVSALIKTFRTAVWPTRQMALRRLETDNNLPHRPLSSFDDRPALDAADPIVETLWQRNKQQALKAMRIVGLHGPNSDLPRRDPMALRAGLILLAIPSFWAAGSNWSERIAHAFQPQLSVHTPSPTQFEAWIDPPSYTKVAPIYLTSEEKLSLKGKSIEIPANSMLIARSSENLGSLSLKSSAIRDKTAAINLAGDAPNSISHPIDTDQKISLRQSGREIASWRFKVRPDRAPAIAITDQVKATIRNTLELTYAIRDDYGVVEAVAQVSLETSRDETAGRSGEHVAEILKIPLALPSITPTKVDETAYQDLTAHPWAGLPVRVELVAMDEIGQLGRSQAQSLSLPERAFFHPLAKAIIEQRRNLGQTPEAWPEVVLALDALAILSDELANDYTLFLGLRSARWSLVSRDPTRMSQIEDVYALLWDLALRLEDGDVAEAEQNLRAVQKALMEALARDASQSELEQLFADYAAALQQYLQALSKQAVANSQDLDQTAPSPQASSELSTQDLQDLLRSVQELAATGDQQSARRMLAELQRLLENMVAGEPAPLSPEQAQMTESIDRLSEMMNKQRALLDETFSQSRESSNRPQVDQAPLGELGDTANAQGETGSSLPKTPLQELAADQDFLGQELSDLLEELSELSPDAEGISNLEDAQSSMQSASKGLAQNQGQMAQQNQKQAIENLSRGANALAEALMAQMSGQQRLGQNQDPNTDPLGRKPGTSNSLGDHITVPDERDLQRARDILQELQRRASEQGRPPLELEYLERLLKRF